MFTRWTASITLQTLNRCGWTCVRAVKHHTPFSLYTVWLSPPLLSVWLASARAGVCAALCCVLCVSLEQHHSLLLCLHKQQTAGWAAETETDLLCLLSLVRIQKIHQTRQIFDRVGEINVRDNHDLADCYTTDSRTLKSEFINTAVFIDVAPGPVPCIHIS